MSRLRTIYTNFPKSDLKVAFFLAACILLAILALQASAVELVKTLEPDRGEDEELVVSTLSFDRSGKWLAMAGNDHHIRIYETSSFEKDSPYSPRLAVAKPKRILPGHINWIRSVTFLSGNEAILATGSADKTVKFWNVKTGKLEKELSVGFAVRRIACSPDGRQFVVAGFHNEVFLYALPRDWQRSVTANWRVEKLVAPTSDVRAVAISPDGKLLAAAGRSGTIRLWQLPTGRKLRDIKGDGRAVWALAFSGQQSLLAGGDAGVTQLYETRNGRSQRSYEGAEGPIRSIALIGDGLFVEGRTIATGPSLLVWSILGGKIKSLPGHIGTVETIAVQPRATGNGEIVATGGFDTAVKLWRAGEEWQRIARRRRASVHE